jgi:hypothetical protein
VLADPAALLVGPIVIKAFPTIHRDCLRPILTAFAQFEGARLRGVYHFRGSLDELHFPYGLPVALNQWLPTFSHENAVTGCCQLND